MAGPEQGGDEAPGRTIPSALSPSSETLYDARYDIPLSSVTSSESHHRYDNANWRETHWHRRRRKGATWFPKIVESLEDLTRLWLRQQGLQRLLRAEATKIWAASILHRLSFVDFSLDTAAKSR